MTAYNASIRSLPMPDRIRQLPVSPSGFPVPWFVATIDGLPDFRVVRRNGVTLAHNRKTCWVCGQPMGGFKAMTLGPMCIVNRTISEPPSHRECAVFSARACPFLANPRMRRNDVGMPENTLPPAGNAIARNPGAVAVWVTRGYHPFKAHDGSGTLFTFDDPTEVLWFAEGRTATRAEVMASIESGLPLLASAAKQQGSPALLALERQVLAAQAYLPAP
jgi:hypothetical protein